MESGKSIIARRSLIKKAMGLVSVGFLDKAEKLLHSSSALQNPDYPTALLLSEILRKRGLHVQAEEVIGVAYRLLHREIENFSTEEFLTLYRKIICHAPNLFDGYNNYGIFLKNFGVLEASNTSYRRALVVEPSNLATLINISKLHLLDNSPNLSYLYAKKYCVLQPNLANAWVCLGNSSQKRIRYDAAISQLNRAVAIDPMNVEARVTRGGAFLQKSLIDANILDLRRALIAEPGNWQGWDSLGVTFFKASRVAGSASCFGRALVVAPFKSSVWAHRGLALNAMLHHKAAHSCFRRAVIQDPGFEPAFSQLIFAMEVMPGFDFAKHAAIRNQWGRWYGHRPAAVSKIHGNRPDPDKRLVVGYVSGDFREHSAAYCFGPVLLNHDENRVRMICYSAVRLEDAMTREFRDAADEWVSTLGLSDSDLAERIQRDQVDILVDLSGHTAENRLGAFALKPAPIQITAWGFPCGVGLPAIEFLFSDPVGIPAEVRPCFTEKIIDLPCQHPLSGPSQAPETGPLPALVNGYVTFGYLGRFQKASRDALGTWGRILAASPGSKMIFKDHLLSDRSVRDNVIREFADHGVTPDRLVFKGQTGRLDHIATYNQIDVVLDSFPLGGGVTTTEALWMGVPVITKLGNSHSQRLCGSILSAVDLGDWIAGDTGQYVSIATNVQHDLQALSRTRATLRDRIRSSEAGNPARYTEIVEDRYRTLWRRWCRGTPGG